MSAPHAPAARTLRRRPTPSLRRAGPAALCILVSGIVISSIAPAQTGDFGRPKRFWMGERPHDWIGAQAAANAGLPASRFELTDDERELRDLAYPLIAPPYGHPKWLAVLAERGRARMVPSEGLWDAGLYWRRLTGEPHASPASRYARLNDDARNDVVRLDLFFATARRVADMDGKRGAALNMIAHVTAGEAANAQARVNENALTVDWVCASVNSRLTSYRYALERLVIATPMTAAVQAEQSLTLLAMRMGYCPGLAPAPAVAGRGFFPRGGNVPGGDTGPGPAANGGFIISK